MRAFQPELSQMCYSNTPWQRLEMEHHVEVGLQLLGALISGSQGDEDPTGNTGACFSNDVFALRAYCWCDGTEHPLGCPPNFKYKDFEACWYKHVGRGNSQNRAMPLDEWKKVMVDCISSLGTREAA